MSQRASRRCHVPAVCRQPIYAFQSVDRAAWPKQLAVQVHRRPAGEARDLTVQLRQRAAAWLLCAVQAAAPAAKACCSRPPPFVAVRCRKTCSPTVSKHETVGVVTAGFFWSPHMRRVPLANRV